jgi:hypothetical protein
MHSSGDWNGRYNKHSKRGSSGMMRSTIQRLNALLT